VRYRQQVRTRRRYGSSESGVNRLNKAGISPVVKLNQSKKEAKNEHMEAKNKHVEKANRRGLVRPRVLTLLVTVSTDARAQAPAVDPVAVQTLKKMTDYLDGLKQFSVNGQIIVEEMQSSGTGLITTCR